MTDLYELNQRPSLDAPVLIMGLDGWIDAGGGTAAAAEAIAESSDPITVATFDTDLLIDYRARRPVMHLADGINTGLTWPGIALLGLADSNGADVLLVKGSEPDSRWRAFARAIADLALDFDVQLVVALGAYPAAAPHTRACGITGTGTSRELVDGIGYVAGGLDVPSGIHAAIELACAEVGIPTVALWAQVPHYAAAMPYPAAALALLEALGPTAGRQFDYGDLPTQAIAARDRLDKLIARSEEHQRLVAKLEQHADTLDDRIGDDLPTGDELAAELERFLRQQRGEE